MKNFRKINYILFIALSIYMNALMAQDTLIQLWPKGKIPNSIATTNVEKREQQDILRISDVQEPMLEIFLPSKRNATGEALLIFPGGGYGMLAYDWEGTDIAKFLNGNGIAGIVVKYRLPSDRDQKDKQNVPLIDAQRALRLVRHHAQRFNIRANKIGILGFSAGGHLASTLGTHFDAVVYEPLDLIDTESARPDFMVLGYPVISMGPMTHQGSKSNLLGQNPTHQLQDYFSNEKQVTANTPPTFLFHATDDAAVPVENSLLFYGALKDMGVPATLHVFPKGGHGFSLALKDPYLRTWPELMCAWIESLN